MEANNQVVSTIIWGHPGSDRGALRVRCHAEETGLSGSRCPWVYLHVSKEMSWRRGPQPQLPLRVMPSGSEQISQLNFSQTPNTHAAVSKIHRSGKQIRGGKSWFCSNRSLGQNSFNKDAYLSLPSSHHPAEIPSLAHFLFSLVNNGCPHCLKDMELYLLCWWPWFQSPRTVYGMH